LQAPFDGARSEPEASVGRMIDFEPTEEQQLIVDTVRQFASNEIRKESRDADEAGTLPASVLQQATSWASPRTPCPRPTAAVGRAAP